MEIDYKKILELIPQQKPFRFVDEILNITDKSAHARYTFKHDEFFYEGHFPGNPITPGVILIETAAQAGTIPLGLYLLMSSGKNEDEVKSYLTLFSECKHAEFLKPVLPGKIVDIKSELIVWKRGKLETKSTMYVDEQEVANMIISGYMVKKWE